MATDGDAPGPAATRDLNMTAARGLNNDRKPQGLKMTATRGPNNDRYPGA